MIMLTCIDSCNAKPFVGEINCDPSPIVPLTNVSFLVGINNNSSSIEVIRLIVQERSDNLSFSDSYNISMNYSYSCCMDFYETTIKLKNNNTTNIKCHMEILSNSTWYKYNTSYFYMFNNSYENIIDPEDNQTSDFELLLLIFSIGLLLIGRLYKLRKKNK